MIKGNKMKKLLLISLFLGFITVAAPNLKADFAQGVAAYDAGDYKKAFDEWSMEAYNDNWAAQRNLGHLYRWGKGVAKDESRAAYWYHRAAKAGFDRAQYNLGCLYLEGTGVPKDEMEALKWLKRASNQGNEAAKLKIAEVLSVNPDMKSSYDNPSLDSYNTSQPIAQIAEENKVVPATENNDEAALKAQEQAMAEKIMQINMEKEAKIKREAGMLSTKNDVNTFVAAGALDKDVKIKKDEVLTENKAEENQVQPQIAEKEVQEAVKELSAAAEQAVSENPKTQEKSEGLVSGYYENNTQASNDSNYKEMAEVAYAHLGSYGSYANADEGWEILNKKYNLSVFKKFEKEVMVKGRPYVRIYAVGDKNSINNLCSKIHMDKEFCQIYKNP